jgi:hypothetical protein
MNAIFWPEGYVPGFTDNFASNEIIVAGLRAAGRVRILTQETQKGKPAEELAKTKPNPMINGHQDWLDGLVTAARRKAGNKS